MATSVGLQCHALYESHVYVMLCMHEHERDEGLTALFMQNKIGPPYQQ